MGKLINRIPGSGLLISSLPGSALRMHVESLGKPPVSTCVLKALPGKLDIKRRSPSILYLQHTGIPTICLYNCELNLIILCVKIKTIINFLT